MAAPQHRADPYQTQSRKSGTLIAFGAILLALLGGFALGSSGFIGRPGDIAGQRQVANLSVPGEASPVNVQAGGTPLDLPTQLGYDPVSPDLNLGGQPSGPTAQMGDKMPPEVRDWLLHLERTETQRNSLAKGQLTSLLFSMPGLSGGALSDLTAEAFGEESTGQADPEKKRQLKGDTEAKRKAWRELVAFFNSKQPPAECVPVKNAYEQCLGETSAMMMDILGQLEKSDADPQGAINSLMSMMGTSAGKIDVAGKQADVGVGQICHKYDTYKWFSISGDIAGGLGLGGGLGGGLGDLGGLLGGG